MSDGHDVPLDPGRRQWLEDLVDACERVTAGAPPASSEPHLRAVLEDVETLRLRLLAELGSTDAASADGTTG